MSCVAGLLFCVYFIPFFTIHDDDHHHKLGYFYLLSFTLFLFFLSSYSRVVSTHYKTTCMRKKGEQKKPAFSWPPLCFVSSYLIISVSCMLCCIFYCGGIKYACCVVLALAHWLTGLFPHFLIHMACVWIKWK